MQIVARRVAVVRSKQTRSGVVAVESSAFEPQPYRASTRPKPMMFTLISAAAAVWSLLALFGHY